MSGILEVGPVVLAAPIVFALPVAFALSTVLTPTSHPLLPSDVFL